MRPHTDANRLVLLRQVAAFPPKGPNHTTTSTWGGGVVRDKKGRYHLFVSEIQQKCGLRSWIWNSAIRHAVSDTPEGPFEPRELVLPHFAHNPKPLLLDDGTWLIYHVGASGRCGTTIITVRNNHNCGK